MAVERGTKLHAFAADAIRLGRKQIKNHDSVNMFINDAIGFRMSPEQIVYYSDNCFGTADAISCNEEKINGAKMLCLRVHDLKNGVTRGNLDQVLIYIAIFCLEYRFDPEDIFIEGRIYQGGEIEIINPDPKDIRAIMDTIVEFDKVLDKIKAD
jgi:hypothetical protein